MKSAGNGIAAVRGFLMAVIGAPESKSDGRSSPEKVAESFNQEWEDAFIAAYKGARSAKADSAENIAPSEKNTIRSAKADSAENIAPSEKNTIKIEAKNVAGSFKALDDLIAAVKKATRRGSELPSKPPSSTPLVVPFGRRADETGRPEQPKQ